jgi:hypothetical protein
MLLTHIEPIRRCEVSSQRVGWITAPEFAKSQNPTFQGEERDFVKDFTFGQNALARGLSVDLDHPPVFIVLEYIFSWF